MGLNAQNAAYDPCPIEDSHHLPTLVTAEPLTHHSNSQTTYQRGCASVGLAVGDVLNVERDDCFDLALQHRFCGSAETERHTRGWFLFC